MIFRKSSGAADVALCSMGIGTGIVIGIGVGVGIGIAVCICMHNATRVSRNPMLRFIDLIHRLGSLIRNMTIVQNASFGQCSHFKD